MTVTHGSARRMRTALVTAAVLAVAALAAAAAPAGALTPPLPPTLTLASEGASAIELWRAPECRDYVLPPPPPERGPVAVAATCILPESEVPTAVVATPGTVTLRSNRVLRSFLSGYRHEVPGATAPTATRVDETTWAVALPQLPTDTLLWVATTDAAGESDTFYLRLRQPAVVDPPVVEPPVVEPPDATPSAATVTIARSGRRGRVATVVVRASAPGRLSTYLTVKGRRRSRVVRTTVSKAGTVRVRIPLGRISVRALAGAGGATAVLRPSDGGKAARGVVRWSGSFGRR
ncbi:hypothetical protein [Conexibacter arvalis]|uniref:Uncharacterized protein n=1 Tax=Conexibacter arvalis TaxID=912552 RepID=A0A840IJ57_9ACTN|nr:hypothetical protein [Conexibacter arvalis]MBB4664375.1 hypothetical protein [Conexibacter arvalis]